MVLAESKEIFGKKGNPGRSGKSGGLNLRRSSGENLLNQLTGRPELFKSLFFKPLVCARLLFKILFLVK